MREMICNAPALLHLFYALQHRPTSRLQNDINYVLTGMLNSSHQLTPACLSRHINTRNGVLNLQSSGSTS